MFINFEIKLNYKLINSLINRSDISINRILYFDFLQEELNLFLIISVAHSFCTPHLNRGLKKP